MKKNTGIVIDVTETEIVLMCPSDGTFKNIPRSPDHVPLIGEQMTYSNRTRFSFMPLMKYAAVACIALLVAFAASIYPMKKADAAAYVVALDINPSIEIYADANLRIINVAAMNQDGEKVIRNLDYQGKSVIDVLKLTIDRCIQMNYLGVQGNPITTTIIPLTDDLQLHEADIRQAIETSLDEHQVHAEVFVATGSKQLLETSHQLHMSVNKYRIYEDLIDRQVPITIEEVMNTPIDDLLQQADLSSNSEPVDPPSSSSSNDQEQADSDAEYPEEIQPDPDEPNSYPEDNPDDYYIPEEQSTDENEQVDEVDNNMDSNIDNFETDPNVSDQEESDPSSSEESTEQSTLQEDSYNDLDSEYSDSENPDEALAPMEQEPEQTADVETP